MNGKHNKTVIFEENNIYYSSTLIHSTINKHVSINSIEIQTSQTTMITIVKVHDKKKKRNNHH